jgi:hypothetical protein
VLSAIFRFSGGPDDLLTRLGAISATQGVRYWSVTDRAWQPLVLDASALKGPDAALRRPDFSAVELRSGANLYYVQRDNRSAGGVVYRMRLRQSASARIVIETENVAPVRFFVMTMFEPGALQSLLYLQRLSTDAWGFYELTWVGPGASFLASGLGASYVNRAAAIYRYLAGIPSDQEPPVAP